MLASILLLAVMTQSPQCAGSGTVCCNVNCGAVAPKHAAAAKALYLVLMIDPKQVLAKEPCVSTDQIAGNDGKAVAAVKGNDQHHTVTLKLAELRQDYSGDLTGRICFGALELNSLGGVVHA